MIGIVTIGHYLLRQALHSLLAAIQSRFQLAIVDGIGGGFHIHNQSVGGVGDQLYVVAGNGATLTVSHHMSLGVGGRGSGYVVTAIVFLALLQALHFTKRRLQATDPLPRRAALGSGLTFGYFLFLRGLFVHLLYLLSRQSQMSFDLFLASKRVAAGIGLDLGAIQSVPLHGNQPLGAQHAYHLYKQVL